MFTQLRALTKQFVSLLLLSLFFGCASSPKKLPPSKSKNNVKVEFKDVPLQEMKNDDWIGGSVKHPVYYTARGARIFTPIRGLIQPTMTRTVYQGTVIYPDMGYQLVGDMMVKDYLPLIYEVETRLKGKSVKRPLIVHADSNRLSKGAKVYSTENKHLISMNYKFGKWAAE